MPTTPGGPPTFWIDRLRRLSRKEHAPQRGLSLDSALVAGVVDLLHEDFVRRGIVVRRETGSGLPPLSGDPIQLEQIVLNLSTNAAEALDGVPRSEREISIVTSQAEPAPTVVELAVRHTGVGGKSVDVERMFERFVTTKRSGLGMGLAISRSIAEAHGGRIYAKANTDRGLTVFVPGGGSLRRWSARCVQRLLESISVSLRSHCGLFSRGKKRWL